jgi:subtilisin family serine protease
MRIAAVAAVVAVLAGFAAPAGARPVGARTGGRAAPGAAANSATDPPDDELAAEIAAATDALDDHVLVGVTDPGQADAVARALGGEVVDEVVPGVVVVSVPDGTAAEVEVASADVPGVEFVERDIVASVAVAPTDPCYAGPGCPAAFGGAPATQWGFTAVGGEAAWDVTRGSADVVVAVLDTGVQVVDTADLVGRVLDVDRPDGSSCDIDPDARFSPAPGTDPDPDTDQNGHGTMVAGIIGATDDNGVGIAGLAPDVSLLSVKVLNRNGLGFLSTVAQGIRCATDLGADVINLSIEAPGATSATLQAAVDYARAQGVVLVAAAGNFTSDSPVLPAVADGVIGVAGLLRSDPELLDSQSTFGQWVDLAAPGRDIVSTCSSHASGQGSVACPVSGLAVATGTSFAAPYVAAAAALLRSHEPSLTGAQVTARIVHSARRSTRVGEPRAACRRLDAAALLAGTSRPGGYWVLDADGATAFGAPAYPVLTAGATTGAVQPGGCGFFHATADGGVSASGLAVFKGDLSGTSLAAPIVGVAADPRGSGYWLVGSDGGVFTFGGAPFLGSLGDIVLNRPIVGMAANPAGPGYWLVASDGGVFSFGGAPFLGSLGDLVLNRPVVGMAANPAGPGYWLVASDGGVFSFGGAPFLGSLGDLVLNEPIVGMAGGELGGYRLVAADGGIFAFGAPFLGSVPGLGAVLDVVGIAAQ